MEADWNVIGKIYLHDKGLVEGGVSINEGKIFKVGRLSSLPKASNIFKRSGAVILPGLIDCHVHLRGLNFSYKEDFYTGTCAAAKGGFTTVLDMPNTDPPTDSPERLKAKMEEASKNAVVDVGFHVYPPRDAAGLEGMFKLGAVSVKFYMPELENDTKLEFMAHLCGDAGVPMTVHAESNRVIDEAYKRTNKINSLEAFLQVHSTKAEVEGVREALKASRNTAKIHFCHVSSEEALRDIEAARSRGIGCTIEVTPHHLMLTYRDLTRIGSLGLTLPPFRSKSDLEALWESLSHDRIDTIGSDHAPHSLEEKLRRNIWTVPPGIPGLDTTLSLLITFLNRGMLRLEDLVRLLAERPAAIFNLKGKGFIKKGFEGDLTVVDLNSEHTIDPKSFESKAKYSPFSGFKCRGKPIATFVNGNLVTEEGEIKAVPNTGKVVKACRENSC